MLLYHFNNTYIVYSISGRLLVKITAQKLKFAEYDGNIDGKIILVIIGLKIVYANQI